MKKVFLLSIILIIAGVLVYVGYGILYPQDLKDLKVHLEENEKLIKDHNDLYENIYVAKEKKDYEAKVEELNQQENNLGDTVKKLNISFVGDSVMLGAVRELAKTFPNSYSDALTSRSLIAGIGVVQDLKSAGNLADIVVINLGANGDCYNGCKDKLMTIVGEKRQVFWLTVTDDYKVNINSKLKDLANKYDNLHVIDWEQLSAGHDDWFYADGIHLPYTGQKAYAEVIYNALLDYYKDKFSEIKENEIKEFVVSQRNGLEIFGNELLVNVFDLIKDDYENVKVNNTKKLDGSIDKDKVKSDILLVYDNASKSDYENVIDSLSDNKIYIVSINGSAKDIDKENVTILDLCLDEKEDYLSDKKHLNSKGNEKLAKLIKENFKQKDASN